jgi:prephenate dehydrogenase
MSAPAEGRFRRGLVVGAAGGMGAMLLDRLNRRGHRVLGLDKVTVDGAIVGDIERPSSDDLERLAAADLVVLALPDDVAVRVGPAVADRLAPEALLVDCCSVQTRFANSVADVGRCEIISINPLFGPGLDPTGRVVTLTPLRNGPAALRFEASLKASGMRLIRLEPAVHDRVMAENQAGVHALVLAHLLARSAISSADLAPPPAAIVDRLAARILSGAPHVYWSIQVDNPWAGEARKRLIAALQALDDIFCAGDRQAFERQLEAARLKLGTPVDALALDCIRMFEAASAGSKADE